MRTRGGEATEQVLYLGRDAESGLERALRDVSNGQGVHLVGIASVVPLGRWADLLEKGVMEIASGSLLDRSGYTTVGQPLAGIEAVEVARQDTAGSLGELGTAVLDSLTTADGARPVVVLDSVAALTDDPGKRFKFLTLLGRRVARDDGFLRAVEGPEGLDEFEIQTLEEIFDAVRDEVG